MDAGSRPARPWWRRPRNIVLAVVAIVLACCAWWTYEVLKVQDGEPSPSVDYRRVLYEMSLEAAACPACDEVEAWAAFDEAVAIKHAVEAEIAQAVQAGELASRDEYDAGGVDDSRLVHGAWGSVEAERELRALARLRELGFFDALERFAAETPAAHLMSGEGLIFTDGLAWVQQQRAAGKLLRVQMRAAMTDDDESSVVSAYDGMLALAESASIAPMLVTHLVGWSILAMADMEIRCLLMEHSFSEGAVRELIAAINRRKLAPISLAIEGERLMFHDLVQAWFTDDGSGEGYLAPAAVGEVMPTALPAGGILAAVNSRFFLATRSETIAACDAIYAQLVKDAERSALERARTPLDVDAMPRLGSRFFLLELMLPATKKAVDVTDLGAVQHEGTRIMLAIELFESIHGRLPRSLDEMAPEIVPAAPLDPLTGAPWGYRLLTGDPYGRTYLLYSIGLDQTDDVGAQADLFDDTAITDSSATGVDFVINYPRAEWRE